MKASNFLPRFLPLLAAALLSACAAAQPRPCPEEEPVNFAEALDLAWKSDQAYHPIPEILENCGLDPCIVVTGERTGARAVVRRDDENRLQWVAFRGTQTTADARLDGRYVQVADSVLGIPLHEGFAAGASELLPELMEQLQPGYRTWLTGHSLGGALAVITGLKLEARGVPARVVTFGQPKVTNAAGARHADSVLDLTRFVRARDVVPRVPPVSWKPGGRKAGSYAHFGREVVLDDSGFTCLRGHAEHPLDFSDWRDPVRLKNLEEHRMAGYLERLEELLAKSLEGSVLPPAQAGGDDFPESGEQAVATPEAEAVPESVESPVDPTIDLPAEPSTESSGQTDL